MMYIADVERPVFVGCPADIVVIAGMDGTATVNFTVPVAIDNSGIEPTLTTSPPFLEPFYTVKEVWMSYKVN